MKVVQVLPDLNGGGIERGTLEVAQALVQAGHESVVISGGGKLLSQLETEGSRHVTWDLGRKSLFTFRHVPALRRWLLREQPDILHLRSRMPAWVVWWAWKMLPKRQRPRLVTTVHGLYSVSPYSAIMCKGECVIAVSNTIREYIKQNYPGINMNKVVVIHRGVDPAEFPRGHRPSEAWLEKWRQDFPQLTGKKVLTLPGRMSRIKGHPDFLQLLALLKNQSHDYHGLIVGDIDNFHRTYLQELYRQIGDLGLGQDVTFTGARSDMRDIYAVSDVVLSLTTKPESFGRTVVEALSIGTPVVGYDRGGVGEILSDLFPDGRVPVGSITELASHVHTICQQHPVIKENHYLLQNMLDATLSCYDNLLKTAR